MAKIEEAFKKVLALEFNSPSNALHYNQGEKGYTYMGIYQYAHPSWEGWKLVERLAGNGVSMAKNSVVLYYNEELTGMVMEFYKKEFWDKMRLDEVECQNTAEEMFVFGVNAGIGVAVKAGQRVAGISVDGVIGSKTIEALNKFDEAEFSVMYDIEEIKYYEGLVAKNEKFRRYLNGWRGRAVAV